MNRELFARAMSFKPLLFVFLGKRVYEFDRLHIPIPHFEKLGWASLQVKEDAINDRAKHLQVGPGVEISPSSRIPMIA